MRLTVNRNPSGLSCTVGDLLIDGEEFCHTLEPIVREIPAEPVEAWKKDGRTAIPTGTYKVALTPSNRAAEGTLWSPCGDHTLPLLVDVPGFSGIRIHAGNTSLDTCGCLLVGKWLGGEFLSGSRESLTDLMVKLIDARDAGEEITIEICAPVAS